MMIKKNYTLLNASISPSLKRMGFFLVKTSVWIFVRPRNLHMCYTVYLLCFVWEPTPVRAVKCRLFAHRTVDSGTACLYGGKRDKNAFSPPRFPECNNTPETTNADRRGGDTLRPLPSPREFPLPLMWPETTTCPVARLRAFPLRIRFRSTIPIFFYAFTGTRYINSSGTKPR